MSDRRRMSIQHNPYPAEQWSPNAVEYSDYSSAHPAAYPSGAQSQQYAPDAYYQSPPAPSQSHMYASGSGSSRSGYPHNASYPYPQAPHSIAQPYSQSYPEPASPSRPRSHSSSYMTQHAPPVSPHSQYPQQIPLAQVTGYADYSATSARPYACDMCALSFNRQHDLKRHRETHTGEKPFLCNGGCGKTFTRKDALKRHQLVKGCGKPDDSWS
ncbi:unnamed protein product [Mycena citricolor]|uniref:C2H2-type domain-containing protein n=1 Tax=Mycena citricolor TaxID=2018698 RepID=A0AAD2H074_9AGAR|nr:unnamed protein product [Mycena citricolor]